MARFSLRAKKRFLFLARQEGLSADEVAYAIRELERIADKDYPHLDYTVEPIAQTNDKWFRQKPEQADFRTVMVFKLEAHEIIIEGIFRRDDGTYDRIAALYQADQQKDDE